MISIASVHPPEVEVQDRFRSRLDLEAVQRIAASIQRIGLQTPISIRWGRSENDDEVPILVAGLHRLEAAKLLGIPFIDAVVHADEAEARLWEISENLARAELTVQERSDHIAEWIRLTEQAQRNTVSDWDNNPRSRGQPKGGIRAAARELGVDKNEAARSIKIADIAPEAKQAASSAGVTTQTALLEVARQPDAEAQIAKVAELKKRAEDRKVVHKAGDDIVQRDAADDAADLLLDYVPDMKMPELLSYLDACGATRVTKAVRRRQKLR